MRELPGFGAPGSIRVTVGTDAENDAFAEALGRVVLSPRGPGRTPWVTALVWFTRDLRVHDHPALRAALDAHERVVPVFVLDDRCWAGATAPGRGRSSCSSACATLDGASRARGRARDPARAARAELPSWPREVGAARCTSAPTWARSRAGASRPCARRCGEHGVEARRPPGAGRGGRPGARSGRRPASRTRCSRPSTATGWAPPGARCSGAPALAARAARGAARRAGCRRSRRSASSRRWRSRRPGRARPARERALALPGGRRARATPTTTTPSARTAPRGSRPTSTSAASRSREIEERLPRGQGRGRLPPPALLARLLPPRAAPLPAQRPVGVPGALPRARSAGATPRRLRGVVRGPHRLPARGRRHAPAAARGLDAQPRAPGGRLVPDEGPGHRLALGRALVHAPAGGRRRGEQQRQLAVDRLGGHRPRSRPSGGSTTRPGTWSATTPTAPTCAATCPSSRDVPDKHLAEPGRCPRSSSGRRAA